MVAARRQSSFSALAGGQQGIMCSNGAGVIRGALLAAGFRRVRATTDMQVEDYRWPAFGPNDASSCLLRIVFLSSGSLHVYACADRDVQAGPEANLAGAPVAGGNYNVTGTGGGSGSWPNHLPDYGVSNSLSELTVHAFTVNAQTVSCYADEYSVSITVLETSGSSQRIYSIARPFGSTTSWRDLSVGTRLGNSDTPWPFTPSPPSGPYHMKLDVDGAPVTVTFPSITFNAWQFCRAFTMQTRGLAEAYRDLSSNPQTNSVPVRLGIPSDRPAVFNLATAMQRFAITYLDPAMDVLKLHIYRGTVDSVMGGLTLDGVNWVLQGVRVGGTVYNRTQAARAVVAGFSTSTTTDDTLVLEGGVPVGWLEGDTYLVLPGPETLEHGASCTGGDYVATPLLNSGVLTSASGAAVDLVLSDRYGEALTHYTLGQSVMLANNGLAVVLTVNDARSIVRHSTVTGSIGGASGIVREVYPLTNEVVVDVLTLPSPAARAFQTGEKIGASVGSTITAWRSAGTDSSLGWYQRVPVVGIRTLDSPGGDYRTVLTVDLSGMNTAARLSPGLQAGVYAKDIWCHSVSNASGALPVGLHQLDRPGSAEALVGSDVDVARNDAALTVTEPTCEVGSLGIAQVVARGVNASAPWGSDIRAVLPHLRQISKRGSIQTLALGDAIDEAGDSRRRWRVVLAQNESSTFGAGFTGTNGQNVWWVVGPGAF